MNNNGLNSMKKTTNLTLKTTRKATSNVPTRFAKEE